MSNSYQTLYGVIRFTARAWGLLIAGTAAFFLLASAFGADESGEGLRTTREIISFICFPFGVSIGLLWGWKDELKGGLLSSLSVILLWIVQPDLLDSMVFTIGILIPCLLFVWLGMAGRRKVQADSSGG